MPFWFSLPSAESFRSMETRVDDVVLSSLPKGGTTWTHRVLYCLLHLYDDDGRVVPEIAEGGVGASGQTYPDALPFDRESQRELLEKEDFGTAFVKKTFGDFTFQELVNQPAPRLFSTHLFGTDFLPRNLLSEGGGGEEFSTNDDDGGGDDKEKEGKGRLIVVLRNLKDVLTSLHFFNGEAKDGWLGNEHGPGSLNRFLAEDCPNSLGSSFRWISEQERVVTFLKEQAARLGREERVLVVYYEALKADLPTQIDRMNAFLGRDPLTEAKRTAVAEACGFQAMKDTKSAVIEKTLRKGNVGDWKNHLDDDVWARFDEVFEQRLGDSYLAGPMRHFQRRCVQGMPPAGRSEWTLDTDPRTWPVFERAVLREGMLVPDRVVSATSGRREFRRAPSTYLGATIPGEKYQAEAGRYHLFVSGTCPWACSTAVARRLLGLEDVVSMDVADGQSGSGWTFLAGATAEPWRGRPGPFWISEVYQLDDPLASTRLTVPVLWDAKTRSIVSNDSWEIVKLLSTAFAGLGEPSAAGAPPLPVDAEGRPTLFPVGREELVESRHDDVYSALLNGVYRAGLGFIMSGGVESEGVLAARKGVYDKLAELDDLLSDRRFLLGDELTAVDVRLAMNLFRWDCAYRHAFFLEGGRGGILIGDGHPNLRSYLRDLYPAMEPMVDFRAVRQYFRIRKSANYGKAKEDDEKEDSRPLPDLRPIIASAKKPADLSSRGIFVV